MLLVHLLAGDHRDRLRGFQQARIGLGAGDAAAGDIARHGRGTGFILARDRDRRGFQHDAGGDARLGRGRGLLGLGLGRGGDNDPRQQQQGMAGARGPGRERSGEGHEGSFWHETRMSLIRVPHVLQMRRVRNTGCRLSPPDSSVPGTDLMTTARRRVGLPAWA
ncbi:protein of unknown function [Rhodovastum atsumiense]|nr:protein of unknown function [Rhodovastum atsumiense]